MKALKHVLMSAALLSLPLTVLADDDHRGRHGNGHGHGHDKHYDKHHDKRHFKGHDRHHGHRHHDHHDRHVRHHDHVERVYVPPPAPVIYGPAPVPAPSGVTIHGNVHIPM